MHTAMSEHPIKLVRKISIDGTTCDISLCTLMLKEIVAARLMRPCL